MLIAKHTAVGFRCCFVLSRARGYVEPGRCTKNLVAIMPLSSTLVALFPTYFSYLFFYLFWVRQHFKSYPAWYEYGRFVLGHGHLLCGLASVKHHLYFFATQRGVIFADGSAYFSHAPLLLSCLPFCYLARVAFEACLFCYGVVVVVVACTRLMRCLLVMGRQS